MFSLSRIASDYFSDSVVCIGILRPLRPLREIKITSVFVFTQRAQRAQSFIYLSYSTLALEWSQTSLRQECAESLSTPSPLRGTTPVSGGETDPSQPSPVWEGVVTTDLCPISRTLYSPPYREGQGGRVRFILQKTFTFLSAPCWAGKSSYRQGSVLAWNLP